MLVFRNFWTDFPQYHWISKDDHEERDKVHGRHRKHIVKNLLSCTCEESEANTLFETGIQGMSLNAEDHTLKNHKTIID